MRVSYIAYFFLVKSNINMMSGMLNTVPRMACTFADYLRAIVDAPGFKYLGKSS